MAQTQIATLDLNDFLSDGIRKAHFVKQLRHALSTTGFFFLANHRIPQSVVQKAMAVLPKFFRQLPQATRMKYVGTDVMGYTPPRVEKGEGFKIADEKHFFHVRNGKAPYVEEVPDFTAALAALDGYFQADMITLLQAIALSLDLPEHHFDSLVGNSLTRALHYPAHDNPTEHEQDLIEGGNVVGMCAAPHTDINMATFLLGTEAGLQLFFEGRWISITCRDPRTLAVNGADMLRHLTGGRYQSGLHRVVCTPGVERYSIPHFGHLDFNTSIVPLAHLGESDLETFRFETYGAFFRQRLIELGVIPA